MSDLTDAEVEAMLAGATPAKAAKASPDRLLTDEEVLAAGALPMPMSAGEAALRLGYKHLTFGTSPGADRHLEEKAEREHPYINVGSAIPAFVAQSAILGPLAAAGKGVQGAVLLARAARGAGTVIDVGLLPNTEARTALTAGRTGAKLAGNYSALETAGSDLTNPEKSKADTARDVAVAYGSGTALGGLFGTSAHGFSRLVGAGANRALPGLQPVLDAARSPEHQGARDLMRQLGFDKYTLDDLRAVRAAMDDPAQAHRFDKLNLIEALETQPLKRLPNGDLQQDVRVSPNLRDHAYDAANTGGEGRQKAVDAYARRRAEMSSTIQAEIDAMAAGNAAAPATLDPALARLRATGQPTRSASELPAEIDQRFGTGNPDAAAAEAAARKAQFDQRFGRMRERPPVMTDELGEVIKNDKVLADAVKEAADQHARRQAIASLQNPSAARAMTPYIKGQVAPEAESLGNRLAEGMRTGQMPPEVPVVGGEGKTFNILDPQHIQDIHHYLANRVRTAMQQGDLVDQARALQTKRFFSDWVERQFAGFKNLQNEYRVFKASIEAADHGQNFSLAGSGPGHRESVAFLRQAVADHAAAAQEARAQAEAYRRAAENFARTGRGPRGGNTPPSQTRLNNAVQAEDARAHVLNEFRRGLGQNLKDQLERTSNPEALIQRASTPAGQAQLMLALGPTEGPAFIGSLLTRQAQTVARDVALSNPEAGAQFFADMAAQGRTQVMAAYRSELASRIQSDLASGKSNVVKDLLTNTSVRHLVQVYGKEEARGFVNNLLSMEAQRLASKMPVNASAAHEANVFFDRMQAAGLTEPVAAFRQARAEALKNLLSEKAKETNAAGVNAIVDNLLTQAGKQHILKVFGDTEGRRFIEQLYNKQAQGGYSKTLYGGSDTAPKMARNRKTDALMDAAFNLMHFRPMGFLKSMGEVGSAAYKQRRADQTNTLLSKQGPAEVGPLIDSLLAGQQLRETAHPYVRNPALRLTPASVGAPDTLASLLNPDGKKKQRAPFLPAQ